MSLATIIRDTAPPAQALEGNVFAPGVLDAPDPDDFTENVPEVFCRRLAAAGASGSPADAKAPLRSE